MAVAVVSAGPGLDSAFGGIPIRIFLSELITPSSYRVVIGSVSSVCPKH